MASKRALKPCGAITTAEVSSAPCSHQSVILTTSRIKDLSRHFLLDLRAEATAAAGRKHQSLGCRPPLWLVAAKSNGHEDQRVEDPCMGSISSKIIFK